MTIRKKITVSTLAVSMAAASIAGLPLSSKGLANYFGVTAVSAASSSNLDSVKQKLDRVYGKLSASDKQKLQALRTEINTKITKEKFEQIAGPVLPQIKQAGVSTDTLFDFFKAVSTLTYDPSYDNLVAIRNNPTYIEAVKSIGQAAGVQYLTVDDLVQVIVGGSGNVGVEKKLVDLIKNKSLVELNNILNNSQARHDLLREAFQSVANTPIGNTTVTSALSTLGITEDQLATVFINTESALDSNIVKSATLALVLAYLQAEGIDLPGGGGNENPGENPGGGGNTGGGGSTGGGGAAGGGGGGGGGGAVTPTPGPSGSLESLLSIDASKLLIIKDGIATLQLKDADILKVIDAIKTAAGTQKDLTLTLDLGKVDAKTISAPISKAILDAAKSAGIKNIAVTVNGLTITLPLDQFKGALNLSITKQEDTAVTSLTKLQLASDVYEFGVQEDGKQVTSFQNPITVRIPLRSVNVDRELLSVAKIVNGTLEFQGGVVDGQFIVEPRDTFSSYAVIENKVSFNDISSVESWAGRQIQVVAAKGAIEGKAAGVFAPKDAVTRAEFAKMLIRALNLENSSATESFSDVNASDWFAPYVAAAVEKGIIQGRSSDRFAPKDQISRAEMATMISRALKASGKLKEVSDTSAVLSQFTDANQINSSLKADVALAASNGLVIGANGKFNPNISATRAEAAVMIYRTMNFTNK
ncbi:Endo-1,4-beta-xylanase A precursor [Paenibacillus sp. P1XP2]|nr:Endo-1,4-beta-xylanase A precursor [Paenibacillus sp. P1XP2]